MRLNVVGILTNHISPTILAASFLGDIAGYPSIDDNVIQRCILFWLKAPQDGETASKMQLFRDIFKLSTEHRQSESLPGDLVGSFLPRKSCSHLESVIGNQDV